MTAPGPGSLQADPEGRYEYRWWDGRNRTDQAFVIVQPAEGVQIPAG